jgi:hypothetical protein
MDEPQQTAAIVNLQEFVFGGWFGLAWTLTCGSGHLCFSAPMEAGTDPSRIQAEARGSKREKRA